MTHFGQYCSLCGKDTNVLYKPYKSRGRFPYKTGALCKDCYKNMKRNGFAPKNREEFLTMIDKMKDYKLSEEAWLQAEHKEE